MQSVGRTFDLRGRHEIEESPRQVRLLFSERAQLQFTRVELL
jgi:hypothetical protein